MAALCPGMRFKVPSTVFSFLCVLAQQCSSYLTHFTRVLRGKTMLRVMRFRVVLLTVRAHEWARRGHPAHACAPGDLRRRTVSLAPESPACDVSGRMLTIWLHFSKTEGTHPAEGRRGSWAWGSPRRYRILTESGQPPTPVWQFCFYLQGLHQMYISRDQ